jgi:hypothetical protein
MARVTFGTYSLEAPETWTLSSVILAGPIDEVSTKGLVSTKSVQPFQRNLITTFEQVSKEETPESYVQKQIEGLRQAQVTRQAIGKTERVRLEDGLEGLLLEQIIVGHGGERVRQMQLVVIVEGIAHTTIASHLDGATFEKARAEFRSMLLSFGRPRR